MSNGRLIAEYAFLAHKTWTPDKQDCSERVMERLIKLLHIASRLRAAGWPCWFTTLSLAFVVPDAHKAKFANWDKDVLVKDLLEGIGIEDDDFRVCQSRMAHEVPPGWWDNMFLS